MVFTRALIRKPSPSMVDGLTSANIGKPDFVRASEQHDAYADALRGCGLEVVVLPPDDRYPDSVFVEDTALLTPACAIMMRPGAPSRRGETEAIETALHEFFPRIDRVKAPGTADAGDIMMVGAHYYIGISERTNAEGARQIIQILEAHGLTGSTVPIQNALHLKSDIAYLDDNTLVVSEKLLAQLEFARFSHVTVGAGESYAANCVWLNGTVLVASGFPETERAIAACGYRTVTLDMTEFQKLDGGLSCLSLRF